MSGPLAEGNKFKFGDPCCKCSFGDPRALTLIKRANLALKSSQVFVREEFQIHRQCDPSTHNLKAFPVICHNTEPCMREKSHAPATPAVHFHFRPSLSFSLPTSLHLLHAADKPEMRAEINSHEGPNENWMCYNHPIISVPHLKHYRRLPRHRLSQ